MTCTECPRILVKQTAWRTKDSATRKQLAATHAVHKGRGLCGGCYARKRYHDALDTHPRVMRPAEDVLEDWDFLRREGYRVADAAARMGMTEHALEKAIERGVKRGDERARWAS